jgi:UDP-N-acetylmuramate dehydrogenase
MGKERIFTQVPLAPRTTWKIGGPGAFFAQPGNLEEVFRLFRMAESRGWPLFFLGRGSNVLIADEGLPGLTLHLAGGLASLSREGEVLRAGAGVSLPRLAATLAAWGVGGFEFLGGIPGTVGGGVRLNAGAWERTLAQVLRRVWVATPAGRLLEWDARELELGYRSSRLIHFPHWLVVEAEFALREEAPPEEIRRRLNDLAALRKARQPANPRSAGSVFKNPPQSPPAGWLIEEAGLKGRRVGGAMVSRKHANFILNTGEATAAQVKALIAEIQEEVWRRFKVALEREVVFLPEDVLGGPGV